MKTQLGVLEYRDIFNTDIMEGTKSSGVRVRCKAYLATKGDPLIYAWRLWHRDSMIHTREWVVQIGLRETTNQATATVIVTIEDDNTLINVTVQPSRPPFVQYLMDAVTEDKDLHLAESTPSSGSVWLTDDKHQVLAFREEIHRPSRTYPIVLIAPEANGHPLVSTNEQSKELVGLAQTILIDPDCDTFTLTEILTRRYSAYNGAINVIAPPTKVDQIARTRLLLTVKFENLPLYNLMMNRIYRRLSLFNVKGKSMDLKSGYFGYLLFC